MSGIVDLISRPETLTITNVILACCIVFHLCCEFAHYIYEFWSHRKDGKQVKANGEMLEHMIERIEGLEKSQHERCQNGCSRDEKEERHEEMDADAGSPL